MSRPFLKAFRWINLSWKKQTGVWVCPHTQSTLLTWHAVKKTNLQKEPPALRSCWERCCLWTGWRCSRGSGRPALGPDYSLNRETQKHKETEVIWWAVKKKKEKSGLQTNSTSPGSDTQSLMVSVTSTEIQDPFAFGWTVRESMYRWVDVLFSSGLSSWHTLMDADNTDTCWSQYTDTRLKHM